MLKKLTAPLLLLLAVLVIVQGGFMIVTMNKLNNLEAKLATNVAPASGQPTSEENKTDEPGQATSPVPVSIDGAPFRGNPDAKVTIVEFTDFECSFCKAVKPTIDSIVKKYDGKVKHVIRHYPISAIHTGAVDAALASMCAYDQQKFWEFHDLAFAKANDSGSLTKDVLKSIATEVGLNRTEFDSCFDSRKYIQHVQKDFEDGNAYTVSGTPTFFINNRIVVGSQPSEVFEKIIEEELNKN
jgi:protein-disulfide isomerase